MTSSVSDDDRQKFEEALTAALLLLYKGSSRESLAVLKQLSTDPILTDAAQVTIADKASEIALSVQEGTNFRLDPPADSVYAQMTMEERLADIRAYNTDTLIPYLDSWATHQGRAETYLNTPAGDGSGRSARDVKPDGSPRLWDWARLSGSDEPDPCGDAAAAGPLPYDDLMAIGDGPPPTHRNCGCDIFPDDWTG